MTLVPSPLLALDVPWSMLMRSRWVVQVLVVNVLLGVVLLPIGVAAQDRGAGGKLVGGPPGVQAPYNPPPFQNFVASPSAPVRFLLSDGGKAFLRQSPNPKHQEILRALGEGVSAVAPSGPRTPLPGSVVPMNPITLIACNDAGKGRRFNLEPDQFALPQNEESVDFILNRLGAGAGDLVLGGANDLRGLSGGFTGYYATRSVSCVDFEGGLPPVADPLQAGDTLEGGGDPGVAADPVRDAFFMADLRFDGSTTGIGVFRTTAATLLNAVSCPAGMHTTAQAAACWLTKRVINPLPDTFSAFLQDKPHLAVDERAAGVGAANVYVTGTEFDFFSSFSRIWLVSCANDLSACSAPTFVSGGDTSTQFSHVSVRPDGQVTITYINVNFSTEVCFSTCFQIKYVTCTPASAPGTPSCAPPVLVHNETQPLPFDGFLAAQRFRIATYPKHAHRVDANGTETYVVWDRCKVPPISGSICPDADVVMKASNNGGLTWLPTAPACVTCGLQDQFFPWISSDRSRNILNIVYYTSENDPTFQHRLQVFLSHIDPGGLTPDPITDTHVLTSVQNDPSADPSVGGGFFGDYIGLSARGSGSPGGSGVWTSFTSNTRQGIYNGVLAPEQNNHVTRVDY